jgi:hypothetical protein
VRALARTRLGRARNDAERPASTVTWLRSAPRRRTPRSRPGAHRPGARVTARAGPSSDDPDEPEPPGAINAETSRKGRAPHDRRSASAYGLGSATTMRRVVATTPRWTSFQPAKVDQLSTGLDTRLRAGFNLSL